MTWGWLTAIIQGLLAGLNQWLAGQQAHSDAVQAGAATEAASEAQAATKAATDELDASVNAPTTTAGVISELDAGTF